MDYVMQGDNLWRIVNFIMGLHAFTLLSLYMWKQWRLSSGSMRLLMQAMLAFLLVTMTSSIESIVHGYPVGLRTALTTAAVAWTIYALVLTPEKDSKNPASN